MSVRASPGLMSGCAESSSHPAQKNQKIFVPVLVVVKLHPPPKLKMRLIPCRRVLPVRKSATIYEENLPVKRLREIFVQIYPGVLPTKSEQVCALDPTHRIREIIIVLDLRLVGWLVLVRSGKPEVLKVNL